MASERTRPSWARRIGFVVWVVVATLVLVEVALRLFQGASSGYYAGYEDPTEGVIRYPFGDIHINGEGFPDREWPPKGRKPRVAWLGDSVVYGIGAGDGHRFTDHLATLAPEVEHLNLGRVGYPGPTPRTRDQTLRVVRRHRVDRVVYVLNLNDVGPDQPPGGGPSLAGRAWRGVQRWSVLAATVGERVGQWWIVLSGVQVFGLHPDAYAEHFRATGARVDRLAADLGAQDVDLVVVILPVEMQVSAEAAAFYAERGVDWEAGVEDGSPQRALRAAIDPEVPVVEVDFGDVGLCDLYVCTDGGTLDWNHLDRDGHRELAERLVASAALEGL